MKCNTNIYLNNNSSVNFSSKKSSLPYYLMSLEQQEQIAISSKENINFINKFKKIIIKYIKKSQ